MPQDPYASYGGAASAGTGQNLDPYAAYGGSAHDGTPRTPAAPPQQGLVSSFADTSGLSMLGHSLLHPIDTAATVLDAGKQVFTPANANKPLSQSSNPLLKGIGQQVDYTTQHAKQAVSDFHHGGMRNPQLGEDVMKAIPLAGGVYDKATSQADAGNYGGAAGTLLGLGAGLAGPEAAAKGLQAVAPPVARAIAHPLDTLASPLRSGLDEALPGTSLTPRQRYTSAKNIGVQLDAADATNHPVLNTAKAVNQHSLLGAPAYDATRARNLSQLNNASDSLLNQASPIADLQARGSLVQGDLRANQQGLQRGAATGFQSLHDAIGGAPVPGASAVGNEARGILEQNQPFWNMYSSMAPKNAISALQDLSKVGDTTTYPELQRLRSNTHELTTTNNDLIKDDGTALLQRMTGNLDNAITEKGLSPDQVPIFRAANAKWADLKGTFDTPQSPFYSAVRTAAPEAVAGGVGNPNATNIKNLFARITPEAQGAVQRTVADNLLGSNATGDPRFQGFGQRLNKLDPGYRESVFTPQQNRTLGDIANTTHAMNADLNPSGSGKLLHKVGDMSALASSGVAALSGHVAPLLGDLAYNGAQYGVSKLINSPRFTDFLMKEPGAAGAGGAPPLLPIGGGGSPGKYPFDAYGPRGLDGYLDSQAAKSPAAAGSGLGYLDGAPVAAKKGAQGLEGLYKPLPATVDEGGPTGARLDGVDGADTQLHTASGVMPAKYRVVEADDLIPSHDAKTFKANANYPKNVQERDYANQKENQLRVIQNGRNYKPEMTISDDPTGTNGPPVVTSDGVVLGGNGRSLSTQLHYAANGTAYKDMLAAKAASFGLKPEEIKGMNKPMLVREVTPEGGLEGYRRLGSDLNKPLTGNMAQSERAVSMGKNLSQGTLDAVQRMIDEKGDGASLRDVLADPSLANRFLQRMQSDGVITAQERPAYLDGSDGGMTPEGKSVFEKALLGKVVGDSYLMDSAPKHVLGKLGSSISSLSSLAARGDEWNILREVRQAIQEHSKMATTGMNVNDHLAQQGMFGSDVTPAGEQMTRVLAQNPNAVRDAFASFAKDARQSPEGQSSLLGMSGPSTEEAWIKAFGPVLQRRGAVAPALGDTPPVQPLSSLKAIGDKISSLAPLSVLPGGRPLRAIPQATQLGRLQIPRVIFPRGYGGPFGSGDAA